MFGSTDKGKLVAGTMALGRVEKVLVVLIYRFPQTVIQSDRTCLASSANVGTSNPSTLLPL